MAGFPTLLTYERRITLLYFAAKTPQHQLPLSVVHVRIADSLGHSDSGVRSLSFSKLGWLQLLLGTFEWVTNLALQ